MPEKLLSIEDLQGTEPVSEDGPVLSNEGLKTITAAPDDQETLDGRASQKLATHLGEAPDGGLQSWLVVLA